MTFSESISAKDLQGLTEVVARATEIYNATVTSEPEVETVYGELPFSAILDGDTKWELCAMAYAEVLTASKFIPEDSDRKVEVAKLIATNGILRAMTGSASNDIDDLI